MGDSLDARAAVLYWNSRFGPVRPSRARTDDLRGGEEP
jgi:hypothetical protein